MGCARRGGGSGRTLCSMKIVCEKTRMNKLKSGFMCHSTRLFGIFYYFIFGYGYLQFILFLFYAKLDPGRDKRDKIRDLNWMEFPGNEK